MSESQAKHLIGLKAENFIIWTPTGWCGNRGDGSLLVCCLIRLPREHKHTLSLGYLYR